MSADDMVAGRELDALIAEKVMGLVVKRVKPDWYPAEVTLFCHPGSDLIEYSCDPRSNNAIMFRNGRDDSDGTASPLPNYSDEIEAAWEVWLTVVERAPWRWAIYSEPDGEVTVEHYSDEYIGDREAGCGTIQESGPAPLAICRAALRAVGAEEPPA